MARLWRCGNEFSCLLSGSEGSSDISREVPVMVQAGAQVRDRGAASLPSSLWPLVAWSPPLPCYMPSIVHSSMCRKWCSYLVLAKPTHIGLYYLPTPRLQTIKKYFPSLKNICSRLLNDLYIARRVSTFPNSLPWPQEGEDLPRELPVRGLRGRGPGQLPGGQREPPRGAHQRQVPGHRPRQLGHRLCAGPPARGLHQHCHVHRLDSGHPVLSRDTLYWPIVVHFGWQWNGDYITDIRTK